MNVIFVTGNKVDIPRMRSILTVNEEHRFECVIFSFICNGVIRAASFHSVNFHSSPVEIVEIDHSCEEMVSNFDI